MSQQAVSANNIPNSTVGIFFLPKTGGTKAKAARVLVRWLLHKFRSLYFLKSSYSYVDNLLKDTQRLNPQ
jgi:hypothetical protein